MSLIINLIQQYPLSVIGITIILMFFLNEMLNNKPKNSSKSKKNTKKSKKKTRQNTEKPVSFSEVKKHNSIDDLWVVIDNKVYDITEYVDVHPGGEIIARNAGSDATKGFHGIQHPSRVYEIIEEFYVGDLAKEDQFKELAWEEVKKHNKKDDLWITVDDKVLDVTQWADEHPGGADVLLEKGGQDATEEFYGDQHSKSVHSMVNEYMIGYVYTQDEINDRGLRDQSRRIRRAKYSMDEVKKHNKRDDCWLVINQHVYDVSDFVDEHPGGDAILKNAGDDSTEGFNGPQHDESANETLKNYYIGDLDE
eukprot:gb/GECH01011979.1/.p1 GENE.gb/GECH01011979.1/~~gb/GECH01011979.1/.p1  ORF type:complete len:308 (+),score=102.60 gb/GECH01011979.1/:1-924(+)